MILLFFFFFFFSSRRRHTRCLSDWSSDVCSSDLERGKNAKKRNRSRRQKEREAFEVVARVAMSIFMQQCHLQPLQGKGADQGVRNDQAWTEEADQRKERSIFVDDYSRR